MPLPTAPARRLVLALVIAAAALVSASVVPATALASTPRVATPKTPSGLPSAIEDAAGYVPQVSCTPGFRPGTSALGRFLVRTYPDTTFGGNYICGTDGTVSEHYEGRAIDWMASLHKSEQHAEVNAMLKWLLGPDKHGNVFAMARRLGVMYVIWDNRIWSSYDNAWAPYLNCARTTAVSMDSMCHRNHVHISLDWNGAMGRTSFFSKRLEPATDFGACKVSGLMWAPAYSRYNPRGCARVSGPSLGKGASATELALIRYSGIDVRRGATGPAVLAVQHAVKVPVTGVFDATTVTALKKFQKAHHIGVISRVTQTTWRTLISANRPVTRK